MTEDMAYHAYMIVDLIVNPYWHGYSHILMFIYFEGLTKIIADLSHLYRCIEDSFIDDSLNHHRFNDTMTNPAQRLNSIETVILIPVVTRAIRREDVFRTAIIRFNINNN